MHDHHLSDQDQNSPTPVLQLVSQDKEVEECVTRSWSAFWGWFLCANLAQPPQDMHASNRVCFQSKYRLFRRVEHRQAEQNASFFSLHWSLTLHCESAIITPAVVLATFNNMHVNRLAYPDSQGDNLTNRNTILRTHDGSFLPNDICEANLFSPIFPPLSREPPNPPLTNGPQTRPLHLTATHDNPPTTLSSYSHSIPAHAHSVMRNSEQ